MQHRGLVHAYYAGEGLILYRRRVGRHTRSESSVRNAHGARARRGLEVPDVSVGEEGPDRRLAIASNWERLQDGSIVQLQSQAWSQGRGGSSVRVSGRGTP